ncbi:MAG: hypothetical protein ACXWC9_04550 [Pseudobdellovibrionaceae bacterium]
MTSILRSKIFWICIALILIIRAAAPSVILKQVNSTLETISPLFMGHISDLDINLYRGAYRLENMEFRLREKKDEVFLTARAVDISVSWRKLFQGHLTIDALVDEASVVLTENVLEAYKKNVKQAKADTQKVGKSLILMRIEKVDIRDSNFQFAELLSIPEASRWRLEKIQGRLSNVTATKEAPISPLSMQASLFGGSPIKVVASLDTVQEPMAWDADIELREFKLSNANAWLKRKLPLSFTAGTLDLYSEVHSEKDRIEGYVKPFVHKADVVAPSESFAGLKHFGIEVSTAVINLILRDAKEKTLATKVLFAYEGGKVQINKAKAISDAIQNGFSEKINPGIDDEITLSEKNISRKETP